MSIVRVIQHVAVEGPGLIQVALETRGVRTSVTRIDRHEPVPPELDGVAGLVVMGGPMSVYEGDLYAHLADEQRLIGRAIAANVPVLGVCLGAQLIAATLGARVSAGSKKEIGWYPVTLSESASKDGVFARAPRTFTPLHWHGDVFDLPEGATQLASSALTAHQAFRYGSAHAVLFHLEATTEQVATMTRTFADELTAASVDGAALLAETAKALRDVAPVANAVLSAWADSVAHHD